MQMHPLSSVPTSIARVLCRWGSARIRVLMKKRTLASPLLNAALLIRFARPRRVRKVFRAKGERVRTSATSPLVLAVMRRRAPELQICDVGAEPGSTRCSTRASERCAMFDSWQIMSVWNMRCTQSQQRASHVSMTTRVWASEPDIFRSLVLCANPPENFSPIWVCD